MSDLKDFVIENGVLTQYVGQGGDVIIPNGVKEIFANSFMRCESIVSIEIPNTVTEIGACAFCGCNSLKSITIPEGVKKIGFNTFYGCTLLETISLPDTIAEIHKSAFNLCEDISKITVKNGVKEVYNLVWKNLDEDQKNNILFSALINEEPDEYFVTKIKFAKPKVISLVLQKDSVEALSNLLTICAPVSLNEIDRYIDKAIYALQCKAYLVEYKAKHFSIEQQEKAQIEQQEKALGLKSLTIAEWKKLYSYKSTDGNITITQYKGDGSVVAVPDKIGNETVTSIEGAFCENNKITDIILPESLVEIGDKTFYKCEKLTNVKMPNSVKSIGKLAFFKCLNLSELRLPDNIEFIGSEAFEWSNIQKITIPKNCKQIGKFAFSLCFNLKQVEANFKTINIGQDAFASCDALTDENGMFIKGDRLYCVRSDIKNYTIPFGVVKIDNNAIINKSVDNLDYSTHQISAETIADISKTSSNIQFTKNITEIPDGERKENHGGNYFYKGYCGYNDNLKELVLPSQITKIGSYAFIKCENLSKIVLNDGLKQIGTGAFMGVGISNIKIPSTVSVIEEETFMGCSKLISVAIEDGVKEIKSAAFARCSALKEIFIPASVTHIADNAFPANKFIIYTPSGSYAEQYANEKKIKIANEKKTSTSDEKPFEYKISKNNTAKLIAYIADNPKVIVPTQIDGLPVTDFAKDLFKNNKQIEAIIWPKEIAVLPKEIFFGCSALKEITLPEGVVEISEKAFRNCESLTSICIPASVTSIHEKAFECAKNTAWGWQYWNCVKTIRGVAGSYAEQYAKENNITFVAE